MISKEKAEKISAILKKEFPEVDTPLIHNSAFQLLVATILSAQTLDATVNKVTPALFKKYSSPLALSMADWDEVSQMIHLVNYHNTKAKNIIKLSQILLQNFNGEVPSSMAELTTLPGVGRKTANVVLGAWFAKHNPEFVPEGLVVDTHVKRVAYRLGLTKNTDPVKIEQDLMKLFPQKDWEEISLRMIFHGRKICKAPTPFCSKCPLNKICPKVGVKKQL